MFFACRNNRCLAQKVQLSNSLTAGTVAYGLSALPIGIFFDQFGLRTTRTVLVYVVSQFCRLKFQFSLLGKIETVTEKLY